MDERIAHDIETRLSKQERKSVTYHKAVVISLNPLVVDIGASGVNLAISRLKNTSLNIGDRVAVLKFGVDAFVVDAIGEPEDVIAVGSGGSAPAFNTGWGNAGAGAQSVGFYKAFGRVWLRGMASRTSGTSDLIFTLPTGYRPAAIHDYAAPGGSFGATYGAVRVASAGTVTRGAGATTFLSLDGVSFRV